MGKVKDEAAAKPPKTSSRGSGGSGRFAAFVANLLHADTYKPFQGRLARRSTLVGLAALVGIGLWRLLQTLEQVERLALTARYAIVAVLAAALGWMTFRLLNYPPFADFLIATEAEMNKVSWISRDDLKRATAVVLTTVVLLSVFLFGVDWLWMSLLQLIGVLRVNSDGFGSTA